MIGCIPSYQVCMCPAYQVNYCSRYITCCWCTSERQYFVRVVLPFIFSPPFFSWNLFSLTSIRPSFWFPLLVLLPVFLCRPQFFRRPPQQKTISLRTSMVTEQASEQQKGCSTGSTAVKHRTIFLGFKSQLNFTSEDCTSIRSP